MADFTADDMLGALGDELACAREFDGQPITTKLAALGFSPQAVREALEERVGAYERTESFNAHEPSIAFTQGFVEGLLVGGRLKESARV